MCPEMHANENRELYDRHHMVSPNLTLTKTHIILSNMKSKFIYFSNNVFSRVLVDFFLYRTTYYVEKSANFCDKNSSDRLAVLLV